MGKGIDQAEKGAFSEELLQPIIESEEWHGANAGRLERFKGGDINYQERMTGPKCRL